MKKRGCLGCLIDLILTFITGGLWLVWMIIRYIRRGA